MDYETQIYLDKLIEAVDSPDWWAIGITVVNALIMIWLGWRQYKLQKQQTNAQEYDIYKSLYLLVRSANAEIDNFIDNIYLSTWAPHYNNDKDCLKRKKAHIDKLYKDLSNNVVDYELKFSHEFFDMNGYLAILSTMSRLYGYFDKALEHDNIHMTEGIQRLSYPHDKYDEAHIEAIIKRFKFPMLQTAYKSYFNEFVSLKKSTRYDNSILEVIKEKCKIE